MRFSNGYMLFYACINGYRGAWMQKNIWINLLIGSAFLFVATEASSQPQSVSPSSDSSISPSNHVLEPLPTTVNGATPASDASQSLLGNNALLTGYGIASYTNREHTHGVFGAQFTPIFLYRFNDTLLWESEVNFKIHSDGETETVLEYASLDWFLNDYVAFVAGKFLTPLGYFTRNLHPAWINPLPSNPIGFNGNQAMPPESEVGAQLLGALPITDTMTLNYSVFIANGPQAGVDDGMASEIQSETMNAVNKLYGGRIGFLPVPSLEIGVSAATSKIAFQDSTGAIVETSSLYHVLGVDINYHHQSWKLRAEYIQQIIPNNANSTSGTTQGGKWYAYYSQGSYRFSSPWEAIIRYGYYSSPQADMSQHQITVGLDYWIMESAVAKVGYEYNTGQSASTANDNRLIAQLAYGF